MCERALRLARIVGGGFRLFGRSFCASVGKDSSTSTYRLEGGDVEVSEVIGEEDVAMRNERALVVLHNAEGNVLQIRRMFPSRGRKF